MKTSILILIAISLITAAFNNYDDSIHSEINGQYHRFNIVESSFYLVGMADCTFHNLSSRKQVISIINVIVPKVINDKIVTTDKLVIKVRGYDNAKVLLDALKNYNEYYYDN